LNFLNGCKSKFYSVIGAVEKKLVRTKGGSKPILIIDDAPAGPPPPDRVTRHRDINTTHTVDVQMRPDGHQLKMSFKSHGIDHQLQLKDVGFNISDVPIVFRGFSQQKQDAVKRELKVR